MFTRKSATWAKSATFLAFLALFLLIAPSLIAQNATTGALSGTVTDATGAVIPSVTVTTTGENGQVRTTMTGADGGYRFAYLPPGNYRVKFEATGFNTEEVPSATVTVTEIAVLNRALAVGTQTQQVTVEANVETVQTASSTLGSVIGSQAVVDLPLSTRNFTNLLSLSAGANATVNNATGLGQGSEPIAVNGASTAQNNYMQDGVAVDMYAGTNTLSNGGNTALPPIPNPDAIQEFKVQTSTYDASFGRNAGANVNVVTKSGTNDYHGTAFEFFRNTELNANDWFLNKNGSPRGVLNQNQYGGVIGGPVKKDKLFFFVSYQQTWQKNGLTSQGLSTGLTLPPIPNINRGTCPSTGAVTIAQMESLCDAATQTFVAALGAAICPATHAGVTQDLPLHGGVNVNCSGNNINPQAIQILQQKGANGGYLFPGAVAPNAAGGYQTGLSISIPALYKEYQGVGNFDYLIDNKNTLSGRYFVLTNPAAYSFPSTSWASGFPETAEFGNMVSMLKLTSTISNNLVNEARLSYYRNTTTINMPLSIRNSQLGITGLAPGGPYDVMPGTTISGLLSFGYQYQQFQSVAENTPSVSDQISWTHEKHTIRTGFEYTHTHYKWFQPSYQIGQVNIDTMADFLLGLPGSSACSTTTAPACTASSASAIAGGAGVLPATYSPLGITSNGTTFSNIDNIGQFTDRMDPTGLLHYFTSSNLGAFVQDDFKVAPRLTLNLGLRWEYDEFTSDQKGDGVNIWSQLIALQPFPGTGCILQGVVFGAGAAGTGCSFAGYVAPSNYSVALRGPLPAGVFLNHRTDPTASGPPWDNFAPRVGFAWQPLTTNKFVVRGGFGYFYDYIPGGNLAPPINQAPPYLIQLATTNTTNTLSSYAQPFLPNPLGWAGGARWANTATGASSNLNTGGGQGPITRNLVTPLTYDYNLQVQYEFLPSWVIELGYVGSHGIHQEIPDPSNFASLASPSNPINGVTTDTTAGAGGPSSRVPYLGFAPQQHFAASTGGYKFNSMQATVRKNFSHGLLFQGAYTWSSALVSNYIGNPNASFADNVPVLEIYGYNPSYHPQRFTANFSYELPFGHHQGLLDRLTSGWTVAGITTIQSGTLLTVTDSRAGTIFGGSNTPLVTPAELSGATTNWLNGGSIQQNINGYFNKAAFALEPTAGAMCVGSGVTCTGTATLWGNSGLAIARGPDQSNWDITLAKITKVGGLREDATLQFRAEFFNAFNHPQFSNPNNVTNGQVGFNLSNFGQIQSLSVNPRLIQLALKYQF